MATKITSANISTRTISADNVGSKVLTADELANNAVTSNEINNSAIINEDISPSAAISISKVSGAASSADLNTIKDNIGLLGFKMAVNESLTVFNFVDGVVDEFHDESGVEETASANDRYVAASDYYINSTQDDGQSSPMATFAGGFLFENGAGSVTEPDTSTAQAVHPQSYDPLGHHYTDGQYVVDPSVSTITVKGWGGGGRGPYNQPNFIRGTGGGGGHVSGNLTVTAGQTVYIGVGTDNQTTSSPAPLIGPGNPWPNSNPMSNDHPRSGIYQYFPQSMFGGGWGQRPTNNGHFGGGGSMSYVSVGPAEIDWENTGNTFGVHTNSTPQVAGAAPPYAPGGQRMNYTPISPQIAFVAGGGGAGNGGDNNGAPNRNGGAGGGLTGEAAGGGEQTSNGPNGGGGGDQEQGGAVHPSGSAPDGFEPERFMTTDKEGSGMGFFAGGGGGGQMSHHGAWAGGGGSSYYGHPQVASGATIAGATTSVADSSDPEYQPGVGNGSNYWNTTQGGYVFITATGFNSASTTATDLVSEPFTASSAPSSARIVVFEENIATPTLNTDIIARVSRDGGSNFSQATLSDSGYVTGSSGQRILTGTADVSGQPSGTSMRWKLELRNNAVKIHGVSLQWA
jgi:hypothetical protein